MGLIEDALTRWHQFVQQSGNPSNPSAGRWRFFFKSNGANIINSSGDVIPLGNHNDLTDGYGYPDSDLTFKAQDSGGGWWGIHGAEMRSYQTIGVTSDGGGNQSDAMMAFFFDSTTEDCTRNITGTVADGHSMMVKVKNIYGAGSGHKLVLPTGCYWNDDGVNRAIVLASTSAWFFAVARSATNYEVMFSNGISYAAS